ncbi:MAG: rhodanese-like domain-containing protein [Bacteroidota bacterium]
MTREQVEKGASCKPSRWMMLKAQLKNISPEVFKKKMDDNDNYVLIDTRTANEYNHLHLENAINIDYLTPDMWERVEPLDRDATYLLYCRSGRRSIRLGTLMRNSGFDAKKIFNLEGGITAWQEAFGEEKLKKNAE